MKTKFFLLVAMAAAPMMAQTPIKDVDNPGRTGEAITVVASLPANTYTSDTIQVLATRARTVLDTISFQSKSTTAGQELMISLTVTTNGSQVTHYFPLTRIGIFQMYELYTGNFPVTIVCDGGTSIIVHIQRPDNGGSVGSATVTFSASAHTVVP